MGAESEGGHGLASKRQESGGDGAALDRDLMGPVSQSDGVGRGHHFEMVAWGPAWRSSALNASSDLLLSTLHCLPSLCIVFCALPIGCFAPRLLPRPPPSGRIVLHIQAAPLHLPLVLASNASPSLEADEV